MQRSTIGSLLRSTQAYCSQLCEKHTLDSGIAFYNERFASLPEVNQFREVVLADGTSATEAFEEAKEWFDAHGLTCHRWAPALDTPVDPLRDFLASHEFQARPLTAMVLTDWVSIDVDPSLRVLPARAMRPVYKQSFLNFASNHYQGPSDVLATAQNDRLDDSQLDMFVVVSQQKAVARGGLYQVGDFGRVIDLCVAECERQDSIAHTLLAHILALAKRLTLRSVIVQVDRDDATRRRWFEHAGFVVDGEFIEFELHASKLVP